MKVGDLVRIIGLKAGENPLYNHPLIGLVIAGGRSSFQSPLGSSVDVMFGIRCRRLHPKFLEVISEI